MDFNFDLIFSDPTHLTVFCLIVGLYLATFLGKLEYIPSNHPMDS